MNSDIQNKDSCCGKRPPVSIMDLVNYLVRYSSKDRKLSVNEIAVGLTCIAQYCDDEDFEYDEMNEERYRKVDDILRKQVKYDRYQAEESVKKQVKRLLEKYLNVHTMFGTYIRASRFANNSNDQVYYAETLFSQAQINILRDSISVYSYAEADETAALVSKLNELTNLYNREELDYSQ